MSGAGERWRIGKTYPSLGGPLAEVREGGPEGGSRFVCEATPDDAEQIVADHNASARLAESEARVRELEAENGRLRPALIHTRRMVTAHHSIGECRVCLTESGTTTWDEGDTALRGAEGHTAERP